ncbi:hypothetical protein FPCIR_12711 [Fusarium pseudocircinatum]|uniref:Uncharacterized protein n=1 Tax=Fusarium pseudocircinatum TaxID=56676 RepID=A0A8H5KL19_9HYPO|nr:hypothetical protein FPCIR_12711 [Fusarium pseudocircinatum]
MPGYRESLRPAVEENLDQWWSATRDLGSTTLAIASNQCRDGATALDLMMRDLKAQLNLDTNIDSATVEDASGLITIIAYFFYGPLFGILMALGRNSETRMYDDNLFKYEKAMSKLLGAIHEAQTALNIVRPTLFGQPLQMVRNIFLSGNERMVKITPINPIGLLLRIVTAQHLCEEYRRLSIAKSEKLHVGLPRAIFTCRGTSPNGDPLNDFILQLRNSRLDAIAKAVDGGEDDVKDIKKWSRELRRRRQGKKPKKQEPFANLVQNPPGHFSHLDDVATPLQCPSFQPKARCTRCQILFRYEVPDNVKGQEKVMSVVLYRDLSCVEAYAHFFCRALEHRGHAKCVTRVSVGNRKAKPGKK